MRKIKKISLALIVIAFILIISCLCYWFVIEKKNKDEENTVDIASNSSNNLLETFLDGKIDAYCANEDGGGFYTVNIKDFDIDGDEWDSYSVYGYLDADNDGEEELVLQGPYGACFFDAKDDKVTLFERGEGTGATCLLSYYNNAYWIVKAHAYDGGDDFGMRRYAGADTVADMLYFGMTIDEDGNENYYRGNGTGGDVSITKEEYTDLTNAIQPLS